MKEEDDNDGDDVDDCRNDKTGHPAETKKQEGIMLL